MEKPIRPAIFDNDNISKDPKVSYTEFIQTKVHQEFPTMREILDTKKRLLENNPDLFEYGVDLDEKIKLNAEDWYCYFLEVHFDNPFYPQYAEYEAKLKEYNKQLEEYNTQQKKDAEFEKKFQEELLKRGYKI